MGYELSCRPTRVLFLLSSLDRTNLTSTDSDALVDLTTLTENSEASSNGLLYTVCITKTALIKILSCLTDETGATRMPSFNVEECRQSTSRPWVITADFSLLHTRWPQIYWNSTAVCLTVSTCKLWQRPNALQAIREKVSALTGRQMLYTVYQCDEKPLYSFYNNTSVSAIYIIKSWSQTLALVAHNTSVEPLMTRWGSDIHIVSDRSYYI